MQATFTFDPVAATEKRKLERTIADGISLNVDNSNYVISKNLKAVIIETLKEEAAAAKSAHDLKRFTELMTILEKLGY